MRWCRAQDLFGSQIPVNTGGFKLRISCIRSRYLTHQAITTPSQFETWLEVEVSQNKAIRKNVETTQVAMKKFFRKTQETNLLGKEIKFKLKNNNL